MKFTDKDFSRLKLFERKAGVFPFWLVGKKRTPIRVENVDLLGNHIDKLSKLLFALPDLFFRPLALGGIRNVDRNQYTLLGLQRAQADFYRKLMSVLMQAVQFQPRSHWSCARISHKSCTVFRMFTPEPLRHQHLDFLSQYLAPLIAKQLFQLRIDQNNFPLTIHDRDRIGCRFQQPAEFLFGLLALRHIGGRANVFDEFSGFIKDRMPNHVEVLDSSILQLNPVLLREFSFLTKSP